MLECVREILYSERFLQEHRSSGQAFVRERKLPFVRVVVFLMNLLRSSLQNELDRFFKVIESSDMPVHRVTKSAFVQARKKLRHTAFIALRQAAVGFFYEKAPVRRWKGFRLVAFDGSTARVPKTEANRVFFGVGRNDRGDCCPMARLSCAFDALNDIVLDAQIAPIGKGERCLAAGHLDFCQAGDLLLLPAILGLDMKHLP